QAWGWGSYASVWWPGLTPRGPAGLSPKKRRGAALPDHRGPVHCGMGGGRRRGPRRPNPRTQNLAIGTWNVTSLGGKEPELVRESGSPPRTSRALEPNSSKGDGLFTIL
ncbi:hypothetical protein M9458_022025, partial [Cirrhinus mrigala]